MKKKYIFPVLIGGTFFAIPYLALNIPVVTSAVVAGAAYGASWLIFRGKDENIQLDMSIKKKENIINNAKTLIGDLANVAKQIEDRELVEEINQIISISNKILEALEKKPEKIEVANNFLNYYLPVTIKILKRYDEIENQKIDSSQTKIFMASIKNMMKKIKNAFNKQLENMYHAEILDTDAEIKVFETMLKSDGFIEESDFKLNRKEE